MDRFPLTPGIRRKQRAADYPVYSILDTEQEMPSVANLDRTLLGVEPSAFYKGGDLSGTTWIAEIGSDAPVTGAGANPAAATSPLMGADAAVAYGAAKCNSASDIITSSTHDRVISILLKTPPIPATAIIASTGKAGGLKTGWNIYVASGSLCFGVNDGVFTTSFGVVPASINTWYFIELYVKHGGAVQSYTNGVAGGSVDISGLGSIANSGGLTLGANYDGTGASASSIGLLGYWQGIGMLASHLNPLTAAQRFCALTCWRPQISAAGRDAAPTTFQRNSNATLEKYNATTGEVELYTVGPHWMRVERWLVSGKLVTGYRPELAGTNKCLQSKTLGTTWTEVANNTSDNSYPGVGLDLDGVITPDATDTQHGWQQAIVITAASWVISVRARKGAQNWLYLADDTAVNCWGYFDLDSGVIGHKGAGATAIVLRDCGDHYRCEMTFTGTVAAHTFSIYASDADDNAADPAYVGDASSVDLHVGHVQVALGIVASSSIITLASAVTRLKDELIEPGGANVGGTGSEKQGAAIFDILTTAATPTASSLININDGGAAADMIDVQLATDGKLDVDIRAAAGSAGDIKSTTVVNDGATHRVGVAWKEGHAEVWIDGSLEASDASVNIPDGLDRICVGEDEAGGAQPSIPTVLRRIRLYRRYPHNMSVLTRSAT